MPWNRSTFPFWFGDAGAVSRWVIPFRRQILSNNTSPRDGPYRLNRSVNCLPLSVITSSGTPNRANASANARHTARPVARSTTFAITQYREWSSTPVTIFASRTTPVTGLTNSIPPTMSMPHSCIGPGRSNRMNESRGRFRGRDFTSPCRRRIRLIVDVDGTCHPASVSSACQAGPVRNISSRIRAEPHRGCSRRNSNTARSTGSGD